MWGYNWSFVLLNITTLTIFILLILVTTMRNKKALHLGAQLAGEAKR